MPRRFRRRQEDPELAHDMAQLVKKLRARKRRMRKHANEDEVSRIFKGQRFSDKDIAMGPRNEGWQVIKSKFEKGPGGQTIEKTTRIRSFGRIKKTAFFQGFTNEIEKKASFLDKFAAGLKMLVEPTPKKSTLLEKNPFLRLEAKRRLVAGKSRTSDITKAKGLRSGAAQFAHLTGKHKEAS